MSWTRPPDPERAVLEVEVDAELMDRLLTVTHHYIKANEDATEAIFFYLNKVTVRLVEGGMTVLITLPALEALVFVADHTARLLTIAHRTEEAVTVRMDIGRLEAFRNDYVARICPECDGKGFASSRTLVSVEMVPGPGKIEYFPKVTCPECEGRGVVASVASVQARAS